MNAINTKVIPIISGVLAAIAFVAAFYKATLLPLIIVITFLSIFGVLITFSLRYLLKRIHAKNLWVVGLMDLAVLPFGLFFLLVLFASAVNKIHITSSSLLWGLSISFVLSLIALVVSLSKSRRRISISFVGTFMLASLIALSFPILLHNIISGFLPCADGMCDINW